MKDETQVSLVVVPEKHRLQSWPSSAFGSPVSRGGIEFVPDYVLPLGTQGFADELWIGRRQKRDDETGLAAVPDMAEILV